MSHFQSFIDLVRNRQSDRRYLNKPVEDDKIARCIEAARLAPSACNAQPWKFIVINSPDLKKSVADECSGGILPMNNFVNQSPVLIVIVMESPNLSSKVGQLLKDKKYTLIDIGIAASHLCLQATDEGLGSCILGWFNEDKVKKLLNIPGNKRAMLIITLGYSASKKREKIRKRPEEVISYNSY